MRVRVAIAALAGASAFAFTTAAAQAQDITITSLHGTPIVGHWFPNPDLPAGQTAPVVLNGPGWAQAGANDPSKGVIKSLLDQGYNVLTWDPRGFGQSGGLATIDAPDVEGRDTMALIDWTAQQPQVRLDQPGDPRVGMVGGSYGGGIQYSTASIDPRLDVLVPVVGWHSLTTSLYKDQTFKQGWNTLLYGSAASKGLDPHIRSAYASATATGLLSAEDEAWFASRGPGGSALAKIRTPTLIMGGTIDTLFPLDEDVKIYQRLKANGIPVKMAWVCGGHGACLVGNGGTLTSPELSLAGLERAQGDPIPDQLSDAWLAKYLKGTGTATEPAFEARSDDGRYYTSKQYPVKQAKPLVASGRGTLAVKPGATSGTQIASIPVPTGAVTASVRAPRASMLVGPPRVTVTYTAKSTTPRTTVFAQLVNVRKKVVVGNNSVPLPLISDGKPHTISRDLVPIISTARRGDRYELQLIAGTKQWVDQRAQATVKVAKATVRVPVAARGALTAR
jgi:ABC-2 type transport system ATP-binding protein